jgi:hypothetical protein
MIGRQYRVVVEGDLADGAGWAFEGMALGREGENTAIVASIRDQAELYGLLQRVADLGLTLLSATAIGEETEAGVRSGTAR